MPSTFPHRAVFIALLLSLAVLCAPMNDAKAQTNARYYALLSEQNANLAIYSIMLHWNLTLHGYSDTSGYNNASKQYLQNAYTYSQTAAQYALQDYNNAVQGTYYKSYAEYVTLSSLQNYLSTALNYINANEQLTKGAASYANSKLTLDNVYNAMTEYGPSIFWAGCEP